jgi:molybdate transport system ATP-binding protein
MQTEFVSLLKSFPDSILVTHSRDEAYKLCGEIAVMENGCVIRCDKTAALFARPETVSVAEITGCKNISPVKKLSEHEVYASSWGLRLVTACPVDDSVTHIGIRAHDFTLPEPGDTTNIIRLNVKVENNEPFEKMILFSNAAAQNPNEQQEIWWKFSKYLYRDIPQNLRVPPDRILLLKDHRYR